MNLKTECILNVIWLSEQRHFVAIVLHGEVDNTKQQEPDTLEPHKCEGTRYRWLLHPSRGVDYCDQSVCGKIAVYCTKWDPVFKSFAA